jgi:hypothetical protein
MALQKPELDHREVVRRAADANRVFQIYVFLHLRPGSTLEAISQALQMKPEDVKDSLGDMYWGGWILMSDKTYGFYPVPIFPFAPLVFWVRQLSE